MLGSSPSGTWTRRIDRGDRPDRMMRVGAGSASMNATVGLEALERRVVAGLRGRALNPHVAASDASGARDGAAGTDAFVYSRADAAFVRRLSAALGDGARTSGLMGGHPTDCGLARENPHRHRGIAGVRVRAQPRPRGVRGLCGGALRTRPTRTSASFPCSYARSSAEARPRRCSRRTGSTSATATTSSTRSTRSSMRSRPTSIGSMRTHGSSSAPPSGSCPGRESSFYLRGRDLKGAEAWLAEQGSHREAPTLGQSEFVRASRRAAARRQRVLLSGVVVALAVAIALGVLALLQRNDALRQSQISRSRELAARVAVELPSDPELGLLLARRPSMCA